MLFSIVVPVYNVESYLNECINSIIKQINDLPEKCEILLVDDGSTDHSGKICDEFQRQYPSVLKVFHNTNHGLLLTRRYGFEKASGDYVINCDSDDCLEDNALIKLRAIITKYDNPDVIIFNHCMYDGRQKKVIYKDVFTTGRDCLVDKSNVLKEFMISYRVVSVCGKICKRSCIDVGRNYSNHAQISNGEDTLQSIEFFNNAKSFVYLNEALYDYRIGSGMTRKYDPEYYFTFKTVFEQIAQQKNIWKLQDFDRLFAVKLLQTTGRAITQSRYKKWRSTKDHRKYLIRIREDKMLDSNVIYLNQIKKYLQKDHVILLKLMKYKMYLLIITLLKLKNILD